MSAPWKILVTKKNVRPSWILRMSFNWNDRLQWSLLFEEVFHFMADFISLRAKFYFNYLLKFYFILGRKKKSLSIDSKKWQTWDRDDMSSQITCQISEILEVIVYPFLPNSYPYIFIVSLPLAQFLMPQIIPDFYTIMKSGLINSPTLTCSWLSFFKIPKLLTI